MQHSGKAGRQTELDLLKAKPADLIAKKLRRLVLLLGQFRILMECMAEAAQFLYFERV